MCLQSTARRKNSLIFVVEIISRRDAGRIRLLRRGALRSKSPRRTKPPHLPVASRYSDKRRKLPPDSCNAPFTGGQFSMCGGSMAFGVRRGRRQVLRVLAALAGSGLQSARAAEQGAAPVAARPKTGARMITQMIGANGWASAPGDVAMWKDMGITWGRDVVGPGQGESASSIMDVD